VIGSEQKELNRMLVKVIPRMNYLTKQSVWMLQVAVIFLIVVATPKVYSWPPYDCPPEEWESSEQFKACLDFEMGRPYETDPSNQISQELSNSGSHPIESTYGPDGVMNTGDELSDHLDYLNAKATYDKQQLTEAISSGFQPERQNFTTTEQLADYLDAWEKNKTAEKELAKNESLTSFKFTNKSIE
jgi:hypothetical protein